MSPRLLLRTAVIAAALSFCGALWTGGARTSPSLAHQDTGTTGHCNASRVHRGRLPLSGNDAPAGVPWVAATTKNGNMFGVLSFSRRTAYGSFTELHSGGRMPDGASTKILWIVAGARDTDRVILRGVDLSGNGHVSIPLGRDGGAAPAMFPSILDVPTPGCWRFAFQAGKASGSLLLPVVRGGWTAAARLPSARTGQTATLLPDGRVLMAGGYGCTRAGSTAACSTSSIFTPDANSWSSAGELKYGAVGHTATLLRDGDVLIAGGTLGRYAERYDTNTGQWHSAGDMVSSACHETATRLLNGSVLLAGGYRCRGSQERAVTAAQIYNARAGQWVKTAPLLGSRFFHTATLLRDGDVLVAGGEGCGGHQLCSTSELYHPQSQSWTLTGRMHIPRTQQTATLLNSGQVLVAGGYGCQPSGVCASAELYDPKTGRWRYTDSMHQARAGHTATLLPDGDVLVAGGYGCLRMTCHHLSSTELYVTNKGDWRIEPHMRSPREYQTATLLPDGRVLVAGGTRYCAYPAGCESEASAEVSVPTRQMYGGRSALKSEPGGAALGCHSTHVHIKPFPKGFATTPWIQIGPRSAPITGFLFYGDQLLRTNGEMGNGEAAKLAWFDASDRTAFRISGRNLSEGRNSPTIQLSNGVQVLPAPGCWRLNLSEGNVRGHANVLAIGD